MCKKLSSLLLSLLLCSGCTQSRDEAISQRQQQSGSDQLPASLLKADTVLQAKVIEIYNDWNGYSDITPILRHYKLRREQQTLVGNAHIAIGGYGAAGVRQQKTTRVKIPAAVTTKFLATLAKTPLEVGAYKPLINRRDDYPQIKIQIETPQIQTIFSSESQAVGHAPWQITVRQGNITKTYISSSTYPAQALEVLSPYIDLPGIDRIIQRRQRQRK